jgi:hypothetical protein
MARGFMVMSAAPSTVSTIDIWHLTYRQIGDASNIIFNCSLEKSSLWTADNVD